MEDMDVTDKNFRPCKCGYQICLFCYNKIKDNHNGACPACRTPYDEANAVFVTPDPSEMAKMAKEKKAKELKDKREQQTKELKEKREAEKLAIQVRAAATATATGANPSSMGGSGLSSVRGGSSGDLAIAARQLGKQATRVESSELARMRSVQRTLVYVIGLSPRLAKEELLRRHEQEEFVVIVGPKLASSRPEAKGAL